MVDLLVPKARIVDIVIVNDEQIPYDMKGQLSGHVRTVKQVEDFAHAFGRDAKPTKPLMLEGPDSRMPIMVMGLGVTEASEMQDLALEALDKQEENYKKYGRGYNFEEAREKAGYPRKEDFPQLFSDAMAERAEMLRRHKVTMKSKLEQRRYGRG